MGRPTNQGQQAAAPGLPPAEPGYGDPGDGKNFFRPKKYFFRRKAFFAIFSRKTFFRGKNIFFAEKTFFTEKEIPRKKNFGHSPARPARPGQFLNLRAVWNGFERSLKSGPELVRS